MRLPSYYHRFLPLLIAAATLHGVAQGDPSGSVDFNRDIRPILSDNCYACHGPDANVREADLRLDIREGVFGERGDGVVVHPGDVGRSLLFERISADDLSDRMPPVDSGRTLSEEDIELLRRWIADGAEWAPHWSFIPPRRAELPVVEHAGWARDPIDSFTLARMEAAGLAPSDEAAQETWIRRVSLDLVGLPPTLDELDAFLGDESADAYEKVVDRLLASPHYGEQMALEWLDVARYADSNGYFNDSPREMWPWRDWVIGAFNENMPYDQFMLLQLAGDMLPDASVDQRIASGFNRNHSYNMESGIIDEEYRVEYVVDRVSTVSTAFMGLTMGCARCHAHKFDPISKSEYYEFYAFFNNITESGWWKEETGNAPPVLELATAEQTAEKKRLNEAIEALKAKFSEPNRDVDAEQADWESELRTEWVTPRPELIESDAGADFEILGDGSILVSGENARNDTYRLRLPFAGGTITGIRLEALGDSRLPGDGPGRSERGNAIVSEIEVVAVSSDDGDFEQKVVFTQANSDLIPNVFPGAEDAQQHYAINAIDGRPDSGWGVPGGSADAVWTALFLPEGAIALPEDVVLNVTLTQEAQYAQHTLGRFRVSVATNAALIPKHFVELGEWYEAGPYGAGADEVFEEVFAPETWILDGAGYPDTNEAWDARGAFVDGEVHALETPAGSATYLYRVIESDGYRNVLLTFSSDDGLRVWVNGELEIDRDETLGIEEGVADETVLLKPGVNHLLVKLVNREEESAFSFETVLSSGSLPLARLLSALETTPGDRGEEADALLRETYRKNIWGEGARIDGELSALRDDQSELKDAITTVMVMEERDELRETFVLERGQYDLPSDKVSADVPDSLPAIEGDGQKNRLDLARWLSDPDHPLTGRVAVNRVWQTFFGVGIVKTSEDFGVQGERPSHPALLDWMAVEFSESGWDLKAMQKRIVLSATYRQRSHGTEESMARDPENRLLARGPRVRLHAENVRDFALAVSGLLVPKVGGPSVFPYQAPGLWEELVEGEIGYAQGEGEDLYRRTLYSYRKRSIPTPNMAAFDAPTRESCVVRRERTNTPLQSLVLMNNPIYVEASRAFAERIMTEAGPKATERIGYAFRIATARRPRPEELSLLVDIYEDQLARFNGDLAAAQALLSVGEFEYNDSLDAGELASYTLVVNMILNLDEVITKG